MDIAVHETEELTHVFSASRDRSVQSFFWQSEQLQLLQTLDEHAGAVTGLLFAASTRSLLSCSADRTIVIRNAVDVDKDSTLFAIARTITLKSSTTSMRPSVYNDTILVSTSDRNVHLINYVSGRITHSFKASDSEGGDSVMLSSLLHLPSATGSSIIAGVSSTDKSIRLYAEDGTLLARDTGHTEGVTDIALIESGSGDVIGFTSRKLVTVAADGTIFIWDTITPQKATTQASDFAASVASTAAPASPIARPPLRKVISSAEIARLQRVPPGQEANEPSTLSSLRSPPASALRKRPSRLTVGHAPRLEPRSPSRESADPFASSPRVSRSPSPSRSPTRSAANAAPSPLNVKSSSAASALTPNRKPQRHAQSLDGIAEPSASGIVDVKQDPRILDTKRFDDGQNVSSEGLCRLLRAYRKNLEAETLHASSAIVLSDLGKELEKTLALVRRLQGHNGAPGQEKSSREQKVDEKVDERLDEVEEEDIAVRGVARLSLEKRFEGLRGPSPDISAGADEEEMVDPSSGLGDREQVLRATAPMAIPQN